MQLPQQARETGPSLTALMPELQHSVLSADAQIRVPGSLRPGTFLGDGLCGVEMDNSEWAMKEAVRNRERSVPALDFSFSF